MDETFLRVLQSGVSRIQLLNLFAQVAKEPGALDPASNYQEKLLIVPRFLEVLKKRYLVDGLADMRVDDMRIDDMLVDA